MARVLLVAVLLPLTLSRAQTTDTPVLEQISWQESVEEVNRTNSLAQVLKQISWQESVEEVNRTNSLAQVLKEYLDDIETVEAATSHCAAGHRTTLLEAQRSLQTVMELCGDSSDHRREALAGCVEDKVTRRVSDVRQHIVRLKNCVDTS